MSKPTKLRGAFYNSYWILQMNIHAFVPKSKKGLNCQVPSGSFGYYWEEASLINSNRVNLNINSIKRGGRVLTLSKNF